MRHLATATAVAAVLALAAPLAAWAHEGGKCGGGTAGNGKKVTQVRQVGAFKAVRLEGSLDVKVKVGGPTTLAVSIDENLQPLVVTRVDGDTLVIESGNMSYRGEARVEVTTPALQGFAIEGSGDVAIDGGKGDLKLSVAGSGDLSWSGSAGKLTVDIEGSGDVKLSGTAEEARLEIDGSGDIRARALQARSASVEVSGSGDVELTMSGGALHAEVNGSGDVHWFGTAQVERASVSGSGEIAHR